MYTYNNNIIHTHRYTQQWYTPTHTANPSRLGSVNLCVLRLLLFFGGVSNVFGKSGRKRGSPPHTQYTYILYTYYMYIHYTQLQHNSNARRIVVVF